MFLEKIASEVKIPVLRKDFVIDANTGDIKDTLNNVMRSEFSKDGNYIYGQSLGKSNTITLFYKKTWNSVYQ